MLHVKMPSWSVSSIQEAMHAGSQSPAQPISSWKEPGSVMIGPWEVLVKSWVTGS